MDSEKSKPIMIGVAVVCLAAAAGIFWWQFGGGEGNPKPPEAITMKCAACGNVWDMPFKEFQEKMMQAGGPLMMPGIAMSFDCPKCGKKAATQAEKCKSCGEVFILNWQQNPQGKCPKCGKSIFPE